MKEFPLKSQCAQHKHPLSPRGFQIRSRTKTNNWLVSFSLKGHRQQRITLGTSDPNEAYRQALIEWHDAIRHAENGTPSGTVDFRSVAVSYLTKLARQVERGQASEQHLYDRTKLANRYFVPFFGKMKVNTINSKVMAEYLEWRTDYWFTPENYRHPVVHLDGTRVEGQRRKAPKHPVPSTLRREHVQLGHFFRHAIDEDYIKAAPRCQLPSAKLNPRPGFTRSEIRLIKSTSMKRLSEEGIHPSVQNDRMKLHCFVSIAAASGMRVTEMNNLQWRHVDVNLVDDETEVTIYAHGKGKQRDFVVPASIVEHFDVLKELFRQEVEREPSGTDPVFSTSKGTAMSSFRNGLDALLEAAGVLYDKAGKKRSAGSFRHFYITEMKREGIDTDLLALNTGTSPAMIQKNYSKVRAVDERAKLAIDLI